MPDSGLCAIDFLFDSSTSGLGLRLCSCGCAVGSGPLVRLRVASCSRARRRVDVSVVVVILRTCETCDPDLLSPEVFRVAVLAGRDCCWRRAAEARLSATEAPREGGLEAIARVVHSKRSVLLLFAMRSPKKRQRYSSFVNIFSSAFLCQNINFALITHSPIDCGDRVQPKQKARLALELAPNQD